MDIWQQRELLVLLKAIADEQRLQMVSVMSEREWTPSELAAHLTLSDATISYHLSKLHEAGLIQLRMEGTFRYYRLNQTQVVKFKRYMTELDQPIRVTEETLSDDAWIEALDWDEADKKVLRSHTRDGKLIQLPTKEKRWLAILRWLAGKFESNRRYTEKEVNAILLAVNADYATLRRYLVEYGFMRRERGGGDYWLTPEDDRSGE